MKKIFFILFAFLFLFVANSINADAVTRFSYYPNGTSFDTRVCNLPSVTNAGNWEAKVSSRYGCPFGNVGGAFDGVVFNAGDIYDINYWDSAGVFPVPSWMQIFVPETFQLAQYEIFYNSNASYNPKSWILYASNDNLSWDEIGNENNTNYLSYGSYNYTTNATINYTTYRWNFSEISASAPLVINETFLYVAEPIVAVTCSVCNETCAPCGAGCNATDLSYMFEGVTNFDTTIGNISGWNTSCITNMRGLFKTSDFNQDISSWNTSSVTDMGELFYGDGNFDMPIGSWDTSQVTDMTGMFVYSNFNQDISSWDTGKVTQMNAMFESNVYFNQPIGIWNTSSTINMWGMFNNAYSFNQDLSAWDTSNVQYMDYMFYGKQYFNQTFGLNSWNTGNVIQMDGMFANSVFDEDISAWDLSNMQSMNNMFQYNSYFNQNIGGWDTSNVQQMQGMFSNSVFNQDISNWNLSSMLYTNYMFVDNVYFNQPIGSWNTGNFIQTIGMFRGATSFNQDLSLWNTGNLQYTDVMFFGATNFNQNISSWDVSNVLSMNGMFGYAVSFNQNLGNWDTGQVTDMGNMFSADNLSTLNYDALLNGWANKTQQNSVTFDAGYSVYSSDGLSARNDTLIGIYGWTIIDGGYFNNTLPTPIPEPLFPDLSITQLGFLLVFCAIVFFLMIFAEIIKSPAIRFVSAVLLFGTSFIFFPISKIIATSILLISIMLILRAWMWK